MTSMFQAVSRAPRLRRLDDPSVEARQTKGRKPSPYRGHLSVFGSGPVCGNGKTTIEGWQLIAGGLEAVTCELCLKRAAVIVPKILARKCKRCGCTWKCACVTPTGPCHWVAEDLCSDCESPKESRERLVKLKV